MNAAASEKQIESKEDIAYLSVVYAGYAQNYMRVDIRVKIIGKAVLTMCNGTVARVRLDCHTDTPSRILQYVTAYTGLLATVL